MSRFFEDLKVSHLMAPPSLITLFINKSIGAENNTAYSPNMGHGKKVYNAAVRAYFLRT